MLCAPMDDPHEVQAGWLSCPLTHQHPGSQHMGTHASPWIWKPQSHPPIPGYGSAEHPLLCRGTMAAENGIQRGSMWPPP